MDNQLITEEKSETTDSIAKENLGTSAVKTQKKSNTDTSTQTSICCHQEKWRRRTRRPQ